VGSLKQRAQTRTHTQPHQQHQSIQASLNSDRPVQLFCLFCLFVCLVCELCCVCVCWVFCLEKPINSKRYKSTVVLVFFLRRRRDYTSSYIIAFGGDLMNWWFIFHSFSRLVLLIIRILPDNQQTNERTKWFHNSEITSLKDWERTRGCLKAECVKKRFIFRRRIHFLWI